MFVAFVVTDLFLIKNIIHNNLKWQSTFFYIVQLDKWQGQKEGGDGKITTHM